jgi:hypothetical protein
MLSANLWLNGTKNSFNFLRQLPKNEATKSIIGSLLVKVSMNIRNPQEGGSLLFLQQ